MLMADGGGVEKWEATANRYKVLFVGGQMFSN